MEDETGKASGVRRPTSPPALIRVVCSWSPVPHEFWFFHTTSEGGLWVPFPAAAQICRGHSSQEITNKEFLCLVLSF